MAGFSGTAVANPAKIETVERTDVCARSGLKRPTQIENVGAGLCCPPVKGITRMCLGIPGKVLEISDATGIKMGKVDFGGVIKEVCLAYLPDIEIGDYAIVHVGFAITKLDEQSAKESLALFEAMGLIEEEFRDEVS